MVGCVAVAVVVVVSIVAVVAGVSVRLAHFDAATAAAAAAVAASSAQVREQLPSGSRSDPTSRLLVAPPLASTVAVSTMYQLPGSTCTVAEPSMSSPWRDGPSKLLSSVWQLAVSRAGTTVLLQPLLSRSPMVGAADDRNSGV